MSYVDLQAYTSSNIEPCETHEYGGQCSICNNYTEFIRIRVKTEMNIFSRSTLARVRPRLFSFIFYYFAEAVAMPYQRRQSLTKELSGSHG